MVETREKSEAERRAALHEKIDSMGDAALSIMEKALLQLDLHQLVKEVRAEYAAAEKAGNLTDEKIQEAIADFRLKHPYR